VDVRPEHQSKEQRNIEVKGIWPINRLYQSSFHLRNIGIVRKHLTNDATKLLVQSMVLSRLDYCNSCLKGGSEASLDRLQLVQNRPARLVTRTKCNWCKIAQLVL
jgi:hypothetical protein